MDDMLEMDTGQPVLQSLQRLVIVAIEFIAGFIVGQVYRHHHSVCAKPVNPRGDQRTWLYCLSVHRLGQIQPERVNLYQMRANRQPVNRDHDSGFQGLADWRDSHSSSARR